LEYLLFITIGVAVLILILSLFLYTRRKERENSNILSLELLIDIAKDPKASQDELLLTLNKMINSFPIEGEDISKAHMEFLIALFSHRGINAKVHNSMVKKLKDAFPKNRVEIGVLWRQVERSFQE
jgi:hypothetical protein